jgi:hypothetical protein
MNLYQYIHSTLIGAIEEKYPEIKLPKTRVHYQVSPVNRTYICTAVPRVIMSMSGNDQNCNAIAQTLVSCINPDLAFINPSIFISDGFINFQVSSSYARTILHRQSVYDLNLIGETFRDKILPRKLMKLLDYADSLGPRIGVFRSNQHPILNHTETEIITLIAFTEFTDRDSTRSYIINALESLLKKYYLEVPVFTADTALSNVRVMLLKQACSALYRQIKNAQSTRS